MSSMSDTLWNPTAGVFVLVVALLLTIATLFVQLRRLPSAIGGLVSGSSAREPTLLLLASSASMGAVTGAVLAVGTAGPGALVWMWITTLIGMALHFSEVSLTHRHREPLYVRRAGAFGVVLTWLFGLGIIAAAVFSGGLFQTHQAGVVLEDVWSVPLPVASGLIAGLGLVVLWVERLRRLVFAYVVPLAIVLFLVPTATAVLSDPLVLQLTVGDAFNQAFGVSPVAAGAAGGATSLLVYTAVLRTVMGGDVGLGAAGLAHAEHDNKDTPRYSTMLVPLIVIGLVSTAAGLTVAASGQTSEPVASTKLISLEEPQSVALQGSPSLGQTMVLADDTALESGKAYAMVLRTNPRGHRFARLDTTDNAVVFPNYDVAKNANTVVFHSKDPARASNPAWDVRVVCTREVIAEEGDIQFIKLTPADEGVNFGKTIAYYELSDQPHLIVDDYRFDGRVVRANHPQLGERTIMYKPDVETGDFNPPLHLFFRADYSGSYAFGPYIDDGEANPPLALVSSESFTPAAGTVERLKLRANPRGDDVLRINRVGGAEGPAWDLLMNVRTLVVRHDEDAAQDVRIAVTPRLDGFRIRFEPLSEAWKDFRKIEQMAGFSGPYAIIEDQTFEVEVHSDARLFGDNKGRRALIPLHEEAEPIGPNGAPPYRPHPGELLAAGMSGPFLAEEGVQILTSQIGRTQPGWGPAVFALVCIVFAVSTIAAWSLFAGQAAAGLFGAGAQGVVRSIVPLAASIGGLITFGPLLSWVELALAAVVIPNLVGLILLVGDVRRSAGAVAE